MKKTKKKQKQNKLIAVIIILAIAIIGIICTGLLLEHDEKEPVVTFKEPKKYDEGTFNMNLIKTVDSSIAAQNYLISPYSIEYALNMLRIATANNSLEEINKAVPKRDIPDLTVGKKMNVANGIFIKEEYKDNVRKEFTNTLKKKYKSEVIYDEFKTPAVINKWVKEKTNGMIPNLLEDIDKDFIFGLANALAIDVEWDVSFSKKATEKEKFTLENGKKVDANMMKNSYHSGTKYFEDDNRKGVIIPYKTEEKEKYALEFIAFLPNGKISDYIENMKEEDLDFTDGIVESSESVKINLSLPKFEYSFDLKNFMKVLKTMGINDVFNPDSADLSAALKDLSAYVSVAVHKTKIELDENGTKAAATTYIGTSKNAAPTAEERIINISFDKPFIYLIREVKTKEILFFGVLYNPE